VTRSNAAAPTAQLERLTHINSREFLQALGLSGVPSLAATLARPAARRIARDMVAVDDVLARQGLHAGSATVLRSLVERLVPSGADAVPREGPLLLVANHPGLTDALAICATIDRPDLRILAADYPLLRALPGISARFIWVRHGARDRLAALHDVVGTLRHGGAVLLFAAGEIEADPANGPCDAERSLERWSVSIGLIVRRVPDVRVVPVIVSGVLLRGFHQHPLTRLRQRPHDRQQLGAMLQVLARARAATVRVTYGQPLSDEELRANHQQGARAITAAVVRRARYLMRTSVRDSVARTHLARSCTRGSGQEIRKETAHTTAK
jgi:hypothetical protein